MDPELLSFLLDARNYPDRPADVALIESHMSLVFIAGDRAYKMKKPIRLDFLDYSRLANRLINCERELTLNRELAPDIYLGLVAITRDSVGRLRFGGAGEAVEWLVVMRRLDEARLLNHAIPQHKVEAGDIIALTDVLARFYSRARAVPITPDEHRNWWSEMASRNAGSLATPAFGLPQEQVHRILAAQRVFLSEQSHLLTERVSTRWIRDGHGDLRPDHVHLGPPVHVIDRLEFDETLRRCDPFDEITDLGVECERLGAVWIRPLLVDQLSVHLGHRPPEELLNFYAGMRASLRARLAIEHLRAPDTGKHAAWRVRAQACLDLAAKYACGQS